MTSDLGDTRAISAALRQYSYGRGIYLPIAHSALVWLQQIYNELWQWQMFKDPTFREVSNYINTAMDNWYLRSDPQRSGRAPNTGVILYDTTGPESSNLCVDGIMGYAISRSQPWFRLMFDDDTMTQSGGAWLHKVEAQCYKQLDSSNFYREARSFIRALMDFSTSIIWRTENTELARPSYKTQHLNRSYIANDQYGDVDVLVRDIWMTPQNAMKEFGEEIVPPQIIDQYRINRQSQWLFVSFCFPRDKYDLDIGEPADGARSKGDYLEVIVPSFAWFHPVRLDVHDRKPFQAARYTRTYDAGPWGCDGPGLLQLSNIKQLNSMVRDKRRIDQRIADPIIKATLSAQGRIHRVPGKAVYLPPGADYALERVEGDPKYLSGDIQEMRQMVKAGYHNDFFMVLTNNIEAITKSTATGVEGLQGEKAALLSAFFIGLQYEFLEPILKDLVRSEMAAGRLPPVPRNLRDAILKLNFVSPLFQMQRWALEGQNMMNAFVQISELVNMQIAAGQPGDVMDNFDLGQASRDVADIYNLNKDIVRDLAQVAIIRKGRAAAAQQQADLQQKEEMSRVNLNRARSVAAVAGKTGSAPLVGSNAAEVAAQQSGGTGLASPAPSPMGTIMAPAGGGR